MEKSMTFSEVMDSILMMESLSQNEQYCVRSLENGDRDNSRRLCHKKLRFNQRFPQVVVCLEKHRDKGGPNNRERKSTILTRVRSENYRIFEPIDRKRSVKCMKIHGGLIAPPNVIRSHVCAW